MSEAKQALIIGFDILPQSSPIAKKSPKYAIAIAQGEHIETFSSIRRSEVFKKIRKYQPDIVATDNLLELAPTEKAVIDFLSKIPSKSRVIQVTGSPVHGLISLSKLAKRHGLPLNRHPLPVETAIIITKLAALGVGTEISAIARETRIVISRARTIGPGGFSQARYQRRMHGAIQQVARNILDKLTKSGLDFDQYETKTVYGWSRCVVHVYESYDEIRELIKSEVNRLAGVAVRISPVKHRSILYLPTEEKEDHFAPRKLLVVGIDAGTTVGIAVADVNGHLLALQSGRGLSRGDVIRYLVKFGKPILITTDVAPAPSFVEKLSNSLQTHLYTPKKILAVVEKRELAKTFIASTKLHLNNAHQRDALAAVAKVFQAYESKLKLLHNKLVEREQLNVAEYATALVFQGLSVNEAIEHSMAKFESPPEEIKDPDPTPPKKPHSLDELEKINQRLQRQIASLQRQLTYEHAQHQQILDEKANLENDLRQTQRQLDRVLRQEHREQRRDERIRQKDGEITRLQKKIKKIQDDLSTIKRTVTNLKLMRRLEIRGEVQPILLLPQFSQEEIRKFRQGYTKKRGRVVYILNPSGGGKSTAEQLIKLGVQVIINEGTMSHLALQKFEAAHIPVIDAKDLRITIVDEFAVVDNQQLEKQITKWQKHHAVAKHEEAANNLERLVEEYRQERRSKNSGC